MSAFPERHSPAWELLGFLAAAEHPQTVRNMVEHAGRGFAEIPDWLEGFVAAGWVTPDGAGWSLSDEGRREWMGRYCADHGLRYYVAKVTESGDYEVRDAERRGATVVAFDAGSIQVAHAYADGLNAGSILADAEVEA